MNDHKITQDYRRMVRILKINGVSDDPHTFLDEDQVRALSESGIYLAKGDDLPPLSVVFSSAVAILGVVEARMSSDLDKELVASARSTLTAMIRDFYDRFDYEVEIGVASMEHEPPLGDMN